MAAIEAPVISASDKSLPRPETNVSGLTANAVDQVPKHIDPLLKAVPGIGKAAPLMNPTNAVYAAYRSRLEWVAKSSRVRLAVTDAITYRDIERAFKRFGEAPVGGLIVMSDSTFYTERNTITEAAAGLRIPAGYPQPA